MSPTQRLCGLPVLLLALALSGGCHRRLPRPGKPIATPQTERPSAPARRPGGAGP
ncbi:MAG: hypothetical protein ACP5PN_05095 [Steroidobacteraceae bacterium]